MNKTWYVYIATNYNNNVLYTGITNNPERRIYEHKTNNAKSFSGRYRLYKIIWSQEFPSPTEAITAEKKIKGWTRAKKLKLIQSVNPLMKDVMTLR
ncbi:hypothetical protein A3K24_00620 [candidate division Kazan bacterium RIFCSPHIGHO2_01_FULL_44_14]|uniref:GIY-YIG domain-containing protein n=1 Tax=candidate division Kazan bacterium RIFCSPLOWO2_01_FULL_45_19 TaxID=1798538 RepID=A0A1F4NQ06_UNCK3|nr:MAG: hypothetical protein A3K51_00620 [candidate division Kazan bacterium RIFCSPLOWO2_01_FULL_45_19]OGB77613.1 MAG: hypothetical protein A3K24_00620 [candidate division Kazan bacterium RIFCSPHIGHO2_01_FULL_44_14]